METIISNPLESRIEGMTIAPLRQLLDDRGAVLHMLRSDSPHYEQFGEIYFSEVLPGAIKAWRRHREITQHFAVPYGRIRLVVYDDRRGSSTQGKRQELILGRPKHYYLVRIPPGLWYGFQGIDNIPSLLANCTDSPHDPDESESLTPENGPLDYLWETAAG